MLSGTTRPVSRQRFWGCASQGAKPRMSEDIESKSNSQLPTVLTLGKRSFIQNAKWETLKQPIQYKGAGPGLNNITEVAYITIYVPSETQTAEQVCAVWRLKVNIANDLAPDLLIGMDSLVPQQAVIDLGRRVLKQPLCQGVMAPLLVTPKDDQVRKTRKLVTKCAIEIPALSAIRVQAHSTHPLSTSYDYALDPLDNPPYQARVYAALLTAKNMGVVVRNTTGNPVRLPARSPLGHATPLDAHHVYHLGQENHDLAAMPNLRRFAGEEAKLDCGIAVFGDPAKRDRLVEAALKFPEIWTDRGLTCRIPKEQWMSIDLKDGW
ncbi:hypothetical protein HBI81_244260 [Parastagonospora nodorum]|nr:hypothetical protein HBI73_239400 [Parastagonospora nodorum]KAH5620243.1 hypothetical protein HBI23_243100 [Parastagonospora nodorum]KAH5706838.1 hypothetical protein HBI18_252250 [Parastagonospora nodorum]KAH6511181.1 hypothetical protein HBI81_244260 [Parastagonospora nodorum]